MEVDNGIPPRGTSKQIQEAKKALGTLGQRT